MGWLVTAAAPAIGEAPIRLPALRQDLTLIEGAPDANGARRWLIYDPLQHKFIAIGHSAYILLQIWHEGKTIDDGVAEAWSRFSATISTSEVTGFIAFLQANRLTLEAPRGGWRTLAADAEKLRPAWGSYLLHTYLFFRIPLARPEQFLKATVRYVTWFGRRSFLVALCVCGLFGLYLVSREWDAFRATFAGTATLQGALLLAIALLLVKLIHELAHAYVAIAHGCRVPVIGVAFILGAPLLYCDVTDAWRLKSQKARLQVDLAGIAADLSVACVATLLWAFLPPGAVKHFMFSLATAGWFLSLTMNLNPFMKFDGYHIASDLAGIENLQDRAIALARWRLREILFALGTPPPERLPRRVSASLTLYAWGLWLYRLVVFTGIALVVYGFFFKLAGVVLFAVEIGYFVVAPLWRELKEWWNMRRAILASRRTLVSAVVATGAVSMLAMPLSTTVSIPAVIEAQDIARLYPTLGARIAHLHVAFGDGVAAGDKLLSLDSSDLEQALELNRRKADVVALRLDRGTSDVTDREETAVLENERAALTEQRAGLQRQISELDIVAPFAGRIVEMLPALHTGRSLNPKESVVVVRGQAIGEVRGALPEQDLWRLNAGTTATFVPDDVGLPLVPMKIVVISRSAMATLDQVELAGTHGGRIADRLDARKAPIPVAAHFAVRGVVEGPLPAQFMNRSAAGVIVARGAAESALSRSWRHVLKILVRESGI